MAYLVRCIKNESSVKEYLPTGSTPYSELDKLTKSTLGYYLVFVIKLNYTSHGNQQHGKLWTESLGLLLLLDGQMTLRKYLSFVSLIYDKI